HQRVDRTERSDQRSDSVHLTQVVVHAADQRRRIQIEAREVLVERQYAPPGGEKHLGSRKPDSAACTCDQRGRRVHLCTPRRRNGDRTRQGTPSVEPSSRVTVVASRLRNRGHMKPLLWTVCALLVLPMQALVAADMSADQVRTASGNLHGKDLSDLDLSGLDL